MQGIKTFASANEKGRFPVSESGISIAGGSNVSHYVKMIRAQMKKKERKKEMVLELVAMDAWNRSASRVERPPGVLRK